MKIQFVRHATLKIYYNNKKILLDPVLSPKGTLPPIENVPIKNGNPQVDLPLPVDSIIDCDAVLVTHTHSDHFDSAAINILPKNMIIFCQPEDEMKITSFGFTDVMPILNKTQWNGIELIHTKGRHGYGNIAKKMAPVSGFVLRSINEPTIYLTGDTVWCSYVKNAIEKYTPSIIICNCGGAKFSKGKAITMEPHDILSVCKAASEAKIMAVHMEAWNHCRQKRDELLRFAIKNNIDKQVHIPKDGEVITF